MSLFDEFEDLTIFTEGEFSDRAIVISDAALYSEISGIFDSSFDPLFDSYSESAGKRIIFMVENEKTKGIRHGDRLTIKAINYLIVGVEPIDDGKLTNLVLKED